MRIGFEGAGVFCVKIDLMFGEIIEVWEFVVWWPWRAPV